MISPNSVGISKSQDAMFGREKSCRAVPSAMKVPVHGGDPEGLSELSATPQELAHLPGVKRCLHPTSHSARSGPLVLFGSGRHRAQTQLRDAQHLGGSGLLKPPGLALREN